MWVGLGGRGRRGREPALREQGLGDNGWAGGACAPRGHPAASGGGQRSRASPGAHSSRSHTKAVRLAKLALHQLRQFPPVSSPHEAPTRKGYGEMRIFPMLRIFKIFNLQDRLQWFLVPYSTGGRKLRLLEAK
jgi:hypothetical protein